MSESDLATLLQESPFDASAHEALLESLRNNNASLALRRRARRAFSSRMPWTEGMWLEWIGDELEAAEHESSECLTAVDLVAVFEDAVSDVPLGHNLWMKYAAFLDHHPAASSLEDDSESVDTTQLARHVWERATMQLGQHPLRGRSIWQGYVEFEQNGFAEAEEDSDEAELLLARRRVRHALQQWIGAGIPVASDSGDRADPMELLEAWEARHGAGDGSVIEKARKRHEAAQKTVAMRAPLEKAVQQSNAQSAEAQLGVWRGYAALEKRMQDADRERLVWERAVEHLPHYWPAWRARLDWCRAYNTPFAQSMLPHSRALRNHWGEAEAWLRWLEECEAGVEECEAAGSLPGKSQVAGVSHLDRVGDRFLQAGEDGLRAAGVAGRDEWVEWAAPSDDASSFSLSSSSRGAQLAAPQTDNGVWQWHRERLVGAAALWTHLPGLASKLSVSTFGSLACQLVACAGRLAARASASPHSGPSPSVSIGPQIGPPARSNPESASAGEGRVRSWASDAFCAVQWADAWLEGLGESVSVVLVRSARARLWTQWMTLARGVLRNARDAVRAAAIVLGDQPPEDTPGAGTGTGKDDGWRGSDDAVACIAAARVLRTMESADAARGGFRRAAAVATTASELRAVALEWTVVEDEAGSVRTRRIMREELERAQARVEGAFTKPAKQKTRQKAHAGRTPAETGSRQDAAAPPPSQGQEAASEGSNRKRPRESKGTGEEQRAPPAKRSRAEGHPNETPQGNENEGKGDSSSADGDSSRRKVFVANLPFAMDEDAVGKLFHAKDSAEEEPPTVDLLRTAAGKSKGCGCVTFASEASATKALGLDKQLVGSRRIHVAPFQPAGQRAPESTATASGHLNEEEPGSVFVGNLSRSVDEVALRDWFSEDGTVEQVRLAKTSDGKSRGFAVVHFACDGKQSAGEEAVQRALEKHGQELAGNAVTVHRAKRGHSRPQAKRKNPPMVPSVLRASRGRRRARVLPPDEPSVSASAPTARRKGHEDSEPTATRTNDDFRALLQRKQPPGS